MKMAAFLSKSALLLLSSAFLIAGPSHALEATAMDLANQIRGTAEQHQHLQHNLNDGWREETPSDREGCSYVSCDFSSLTSGVYVNKTSQRDQLFADCGITVTPFQDVNVNVFDSANIRSQHAQDDPDLGAPNRVCGIGGGKAGPGRGRGGKPHAAWPNCQPQGNLLMIQNSEIRERKPSNSPYGGCFNILFDRPASLVDAGLLDVEEIASITVIDRDGQKSLFFSPENVGDNGFWRINASSPEFSSLTNVVEVQLCLAGSGAMSYIEYKVCGTLSPKPTSTSRRLMSFQTYFRDLIQSIIRSTSSPTAKPPTVSPTPAPTDSPTATPTPAPTSSPTASPSEADVPQVVVLTASPSASPTASPTIGPTASPMPAPSGSPTASPTPVPSGSPTASPTPVPSGLPTASPTPEPTGSPTASPTSHPTSSPTSSPTASPTMNPSDIPSDSPSPAPTSDPSSFPTSLPTGSPTGSPIPGPTPAPSGTPTTSPTPRPSGSPTSLPTPAPTGLPTRSPTALPTPGPTGSPIMAGSGTCDIVECDFSTLRVGYELGDERQANTLQNDCHMSVISTNTENERNVVNVFDTSNIIGKKRQDDPDLGSPNKKCPGGGPGIGNGGIPDAAFPNCEAQGNVLIIQDGDIGPAIPRDTNKGGCFEFTFDKSVALLNFALLDVDWFTTYSITVTNSKGAELPMLGIPEQIGRNGLWVANKTMSLEAYDDVREMKFCFSKSGAISYIDFAECE